VNAQTHTVLILVKERFTPALIWLDSRHGREANHYPSV